MAAGGSPHVPIIPPVAGGIRGGVTKEFLSIFRLGFVSPEMTLPMQRFKSKLTHTLPGKEQKGINYFHLNKHPSTVEQPVNGEGRESRWSGVMCNLASQWTVGRPGRPIAAGVKEINSTVSSSKI